MRSVAFCYSLCMYRVMARRSSGQWRSCKRWPVSWSCISICLERFSFDCRKVIGFAFTRLRDWLKRFASFFFNQSEVKPKPIVSLLPALCVSYM